MSSIITSSYTLSLYRILKPYKHKLISENKLSKKNLKTLQHLFHPLIKSFTTFEKQNNSYVLNFQSI